MTQTTATQEEAEGPLGLVWWCQLPQAPEAPSRWPGVRWVCLAQAQAPSRSRQGLFLGPLHLRATGRAPPSQAQPSPLMKACVCSSYGGILSSSVGLAVWGAGTGGGVS